MFGVVNILKLSPNHKRMKLIAVITAVVVLTLCVVVSAQSGKPSTAALREKTFELVWKTVNEKYFDPTFGGVDWKKIHEEYAPRVAQTKNDEELIELLTEMVGKLPVSHLEIVPAAALERVKRKLVYVGVSLKEVEGRVTIWRLWPNSPAAQSPLRTGFIITKLDDAPVEKLEDALRKLSGEAGTKLRITYLDENDLPREVVLERRELPLTELVAEKNGPVPTQYSVFRTERLRDGIAYIHFSTFIARLKEKLEAAMATMHDAPGLIIDLRGNGGGDDSVGIALANLLFEKRTQLMITRTRKGDDLYYAAKPKKNAYTGPVVILLDAQSGSASEQFAAGLQEVGRASVIGMTSEGEDMDADGIELPIGGFLIYPYGLPRTPKGVVIEGRGVIPNIEVPLKRSDLLQGKDSQIEAAITHLQTMRSRANSAAQP